MPSHRARRDLLFGGRVLNDGTQVWRVGHVAGPLDFPPPAFIPDPPAGRFDDPTKRYRTLYCSRFQSIALRESLQHFRIGSETRARGARAFGGKVPAARVPDGWRAQRVLAPARVRLAAGGELARYEDPDLLRGLEEAFADFLAERGVEHLDIPALRSKDRTTSQLLGRFLYERGYAGVVFESALPPGGACGALFEGRAWLEPAGVARPLTISFYSLRSVAKEFELELS